MSRLSQDALEQQEALLSCAKCHAKSPVSTMKYNSTGELLICGPCYQKEHSKKVDALPSLARERFDRVELDLTRVSYHCASCNYSFTRKADPNYNGKCPYCNRHGAKETNMTQSKAKPKPGVFKDVDDLF